MNFNELVKKYVTDDAKSQAFLDEMKASKFYLSSEENLDKRYNKLKSDNDALNAEHTKSLELIEQLKQGSADNQAMQARIAEYEKTIQGLQAEKLELEKDNALKVALLSNKAKGDDIDYLMFKLKNSDKEIKFNDKGEISNINDLMDAMKKSYPNNFEASARKVVEVKDLPDDESQEPKITKELFDKMGYNERNKLFNENKALYDKLNSEENK